jgi:hypothetical protein
MERFRVTFGDEVHTIGVNEPGVVSVTFSAVVRETSDPAEQHECCLRLGGLESSTGTFVDWPGCHLKPGDRVMIEILPDGSFDEPSSRRQEIRETLRNAKANSVRHLAAELGWTVIENDSSSNS